MANLLSLIKLRRHNVEEKQKFLGDLYRDAEVIAQSRKTLEERLRNERDVLDREGTLEMYAYFGRFSQNINRMMERLDKEKVKLEMRIQIAQDDVREAFAAMKKIEIVQKDRETAEKKYQADKEGREMDEIGLDGYRRNGEDTEL